LSNSAPLASTHSQEEIEHGDKENWKKVGAFAHEAAEAMPGKPAHAAAQLPPAAMGLAGMIQGKVAQKHPAALTLMELTEEQRQRVK
jgi:hypothetical protein